MSLRLLVLPVVAVGGAFLVGRALAPDAKPPPAPLVVVPSDSGAAVRARAIVDGAVRARRWTRADAAALLAEIPRLDRAIAAEILSRLDAAVNAREVTVETPGTLLEHVRRTP